MHFDYHTLFQTRYIVLAALLASALFVHYRGQVRHRFARQLTDHSTFLAPLNALIYMFSRVPSKPYQNVEDFPHLQPLKDNWQAIRDEGLRLMDEGFVRTSTGHNDLAFHSFFRLGWKRFYLKWYDDPLPSAEQFCPKTVELLKSIPSVHGAMFAMLPAGGRLGAHRDPFAGSLRYHLGLRTANSDACWIDVDGIRYSWRDGEAVMFDETYVHAAKNETNVDRLILFCDVERPLKGWLPTAINRFIIHHLVKITATQNVEGEPVGLANHLFAPVYHVRILFKRLKNWNRKVYYGIKYAGICVALVAILK